MSGQFVWQLSETLPLPKIIVHAEFLEDISLNKNFSIQGHDFERLVICYSSRRERNVREISDERLVRVYTDRQTWLLNTPWSGYKKKVNI